MKKYVLFLLFALYGKSVLNAQIYPPISKTEKQKLENRINLLTKKCIKKQIDYPENITREERLKIYAKNDSLLRIWSGCRNSKGNIIKGFASEPSIYRHLSRYTDSILPIIADKYNTMERYRVVLSLLDLPQNLKDSILHYKKTELYIKARLGDKNAEKQIINEFEDLIKKKDFKIKKVSNLLWKLMYINSEKTINSVLKALSSDKYIEYTGSSQYGFQNTLKQYSISYLIIKLGLHKFYPQIKVFDTREVNEFIPEEYLDDTNKYLHMSYSEKALQYYFKVVEDEVYKIYGRKIKIKAPLLYTEIGGDRP